MSVNRGKQFENKLKEDFEKIPNSFIYRIPDQLSGYKSTSQNLCDFVGYCYPNIYFLEAKTILGNTFPLSNLSQLDKLLSIGNVKGIYRGVVIWYQNHDRVLYVPINTINKMKQDGKKSVNIRTIQNDGYEFVEIPSVKKRVFLDSDYSVLCNLPENW